MKQLMRKVSKNEDENGNDGQRLVPSHWSKNANEFLSTMTKAESAEQLSKVCYTQSYLESC
jgi:hypothetical protein